MRPRAAPLLAALLLVVPALTALAPVTEAQAPEQETRGAKRVTLKPGAGHEVDLANLTKGTILAFEYKSPDGVPLRFDVHTHRDGEVVYVRPPTTQPAGNGAVVADAPGTYSLYWQNVGNTSGLLEYTWQLIPNDKGADASPAPTVDRPLNAAGALAAAGVLALLALAARGRRE